MKFNPEDGTLGGPRCRNCHKGSSGCGGCHNTNGGVNPSEMLSRNDANQWAHAVDKAADNGRTDIYQFFAMVMANEGTRTAGLPGYGATADKFGLYWPTLDSLKAWTTDYKAYTLYNPMLTSTGETNTVSQILPTSDPATIQSGLFKVSRTVTYPNNWRTSAADMGEPGALSGGATCSDDGFSWPHRTLGWKMLKDDLFGLDFDGRAVAVGQFRTYGTDTTPNDKSDDPLGQGLKVHDLDSVCLDCHNPTVWNNGQVQTKDGHVDAFVDANGDRIEDSPNADKRNDDLLGRGLP